MLSGKWTGLRVVAISCPQRSLSETEGRSDVNDHVGVAALGDQRGSACCAHPSGVETTSSLRRSSGHEQRPEVVAHDLAHVAGAQLGEVLGEVRRFGEGVV